MMNVTTTLIGVAMVVYGFATLLLRQVKPGVFRKLGPMRERFGHTPGTVIHVVAYSLLPIGAGTIFIITGLAGHAAF